MIVYSNGRFHRENEPAVTLGSGGFLHGNGVFTTLRLCRGQAPDLAAHFRRLKKHGRHLELESPLSLTSMAEVVSHLIVSNKLSKKDMRLRITLAENDGQSFLALVPGPLPPDLPRWQKEGIPVITLGPDFQRTQLPRFKTLNYLPSVLALKQAAAHRCPEAVILDSGARVLEGAVSNIFLVHHGSLLTPEDDGRILPGLTRGRVLALAENLGLAAEEMALTRDDLQAASEIFLTNSVRQLVPVVRLDDQVIGTGRPGPVTKRILREYRKGRQAPDIK